MDMQPTLTSQVLAWLNGLAIPTLAIIVWKASWWVSKQKQTISTVLSDINTIKTNHLAHMQESLENIKTGQEKMAADAERHKGEIVSAIQTSQTAIVQAIIASKR